MEPPPERFPPAGTGSASAAHPVVAALTGQLPASAVLTDPAVTAGRLRDWTGRWQGAAIAVVRPRDEAELAATLRCCAAHRVGVVVQGGNTGLVGGAVPGPGDVLISLAGFGSVEAVDPVTATALVGAGVTLADLQRHAYRFGLELPVDLAARDSATVGGMAATNAGGTSVLAAGSMRSHVLAVDALDVDGQVLTRLHPLVKDNTGYSLAGLLVGSEGTLGVITRLLLRLAPVAASRATAVLAVEDLASAAGVVASLRGRLPTLRAAEVVDGPTRRLVTRSAGLDPLPVSSDGAWLLLVEHAGAAEELALALTGAGCDGEGHGGTAEILTVVSDAAGRRRLWAYREGATAAVGTRGVPHKFDVTLPTAALSPFHGALGRLLAGLTPPPGTPVECYIWGHVGDGNLHVNLIGVSDAGPAGSPGRGGGTDSQILRLVAEHGGSISAEHGIGRAKAQYLPLARTPAEIAAMRRLKTALDPRQRLGVPLLGLGTSAEPFSG